MIKGYLGTLYGVNRQLKFSDVWTNSDDFLNEYTSAGIPSNIPRANATTLFYLLYAKYGNSTIASSDINRFKYNLFSIIWQYGPNWVKRLEVQEKLRQLSDEELREGARAIYNAAKNPSTDPTNFTDQELQYIDGQNVTKHKKGKVEGYAMLIELLDDNVTESFLSRFKKLFKSFVMPEIPLLYEDEGEEEDV